MLASKLDSSLHKCKENWRWSLGPIGLFDNMGQRRVKVVQELKDLIDVPHWFSLKSLGRDYRCVIARNTCIICCI